MKIPYSDEGHTRKWSESPTANFIRESGRTMEQWGEIVRAVPYTNPREISVSAGNFGMVAQRVYGLGNNHIGLVLSSVFGNAWEADPEGLVEQPFSKHREQIPAYEAVVWAGSTVGDEAVCSARKTMVAPVRNKQFCAIQPTDRGHAVGLVCQDPVLKDPVLTPIRNLGSGRIVGGICLRSPSEVNAQVVRLLKRSYELS